MFVAVKGETIADAEESSSHFYRFHNHIVWQKQTGRLQAHTKKEHVIVIVCVQQQVVFKLTCNQLHTASVNNFYRSWVSANNTIKTDINKYRAQEDIYRISVHYMNCCVHLRFLWLCIMHSINICKLWKYQLISEVSSRWSVLLKTWWRFIKWYCN